MEQNFQVSPEGIDKEFIQSLKKAQDIVVRAEKVDDYRYLARVEFIVREQHKNGWTKPEERAVFEGIPAHFQSWQGSGKMTKACFVNLYKSGGWQALQIILRPGDRIFFTFMDNRNGYLEKAKVFAKDFGEEARHHHNYEGLHNDTLYVTVTRIINRKQVQIIKDLELASQISPNNSARAIQA